MPLNDREQSILDEIERHFYQEDPDLVAKVRRVSLGRSRWVSRWAALGIVAGMVLLVTTFSISIWLALAGFLLMVGSATLLAQALKSRSSENATVSAKIPRIRFPRGLGGRFRFRR